MGLYSVVIILIVMGLITSGCDNTFRQKFPNTEIIYQASELEKPAIGFINADGTGKKILSISVFPTDPVWSSNNKTIYFREAEGDFGNIETRSGPIYFWHEGSGVDSCDILNVDPVYPVPGTNDVIVHTLNAIQQINTETCKVTRVYLDLRQSGKEEGVFGLSLSTDGRYLVYSESEKSPWDSTLSSLYKIRILDRNNGHIRDIGEGINPSLSPDGNWVAYTWIDGIYIVKRDGTFNKKLIDYDAKEIASDLQTFERMPPKPRWSPDGKWLIYHKCVTRPKNSCDRLNDYSIFRFNLSDGVEEKILDGGLNPYWKQ